ncbi:MAG: tetratricopeptide repeat protein [bacterium]
MFSKRIYFFQIVLILSLLFLNHSQGFAETIPGTVKSETPGEKNEESVKEQKKEENIGDKEEYIRKRTVVVKDYMITGLFEKAIDVYNEILNVDPENKEAIEGIIDAYNRLAGSYMEKKNYSDAIKALKKLLNIKPENAEILFKLGMAYFSMPGNYWYKDAEDVFKKVVSIGSKDGLIGESHFYLAQIYFAQKKNEDAKTEIESAIKNNRDNPEYHSWASKIYMSLGLLDKSEHEIRQAIELNPENEEYRKMFQEIKRDSRELAASFEAAEDAIYEAPMSVKGSSSSTKRLRASPFYSSEAEGAFSMYKKDEVPVAPAAMEPKKEEKIKEIYLSGSGLKAGYSNDNKQFNYFIDYLNKFAHLQHYPINISERIILTVKDINGNSLPNAEINIFSNNNLISKGQTYSDGSFMFFPSEHAGNISKYKTVINYVQTKKEITIERAGKREIEVKLDYQKSASENVPIDILFIFDVTGSMKEEIDRLKSSIELIKLNIASISSKPEVRFGMVLFRDRRDEFVTKIIPLTKDLNIFQEELNKVKTAGGGDGPEDLQSALKDSIQQIDWNKNGIRLSFIVTDAPPHLDYGQTYTYVNAAKDAKDKGIKIYSVGTGGLDPMGEYILRQLSQYTSAKYIFLTYGEKGESEGGMPGSVSHHTGSNYETDKLEAIIIKIAKEELSNFTDQPVEEGEDYFIANKIESEKKEETLKKLFDMAASQLIDYSSYTIDDNTPAAVLSISTKETAQNKNAEYFTEQLMLSLTKKRKFKMVERKDLQNAVKEMELSMAGFMDEKNAVKVGNMIGAKMLVYGDMYIKDDNFELFLKLMRVETGEILSVTKSKINMGLGL